MQHPVATLGQASPKGREIQHLDTEKEKKNLKHFLYVGGISAAHWQEGKAENVDRYSFSKVQCVEKHVF